MATSTNTGHFSLASSPVSITVNFPTDVGRFTLAANDLTIPAAGLPLAINRAHDARFGNGNSLGSNARLDYEAASIQKSGTLATGWTGTKSGITHCINETTLHLITITLGEGETYYFRPKIVFTSNGSSCKSSAQPPNCYNFHTIRFDFDPVVSGQGSLSVPVLSNRGMDDGLSGWTVPLTAVRYGSLDGFPISNYDPALNDFTFTAPDGTQYKFDASGKLAQRIDRNSNTLFYASGSISNSCGKMVTLTRDGSSRITEIRDPIALSSNGAPAVKYSYDASGRMTNVARMVDRAGAGTYENTAYRYDDTTLTNLITRVIDPRGITTISNAYDSFGRLTRQYDALNNYTSFAYEDNGRRQVVTDKNGKTSRQNLTESAQLASIQNAEGAVTSYSYDANGRRIAEVTPVGATNSYAYNSRDDLTGVTNELNFTSSATYNSFGLPLIVVDAMGFGTTNGYDTKGNLLATTNALGVVSRYGYDTQGNRKAETNALGLSEQTVTLYAYDGFGYLTNLTDALGNSTAYSYDTNGNRLTEIRTRTLAGGTTQTLGTTNIYDAANRAIAVTEADVFIARTVFNPMGKTAYTTNKLGVITRFDYDARGLLTNTVFALGTAQEVTESGRYDAEGRRTNSVDRAGRTTAFTYDGVGRLKHTTFADGTYTDNQYDTGGRLFATTQGPRSPGGAALPPAGLQTQFQYDAAGRRVAVVNALTQTNRYSYDANGNQTNFVDALGRSTAYVFDRLNRQTQITYPDTSTEQYAYDGLNRRVGVTNQAGIVARFGYDTQGRLLAVTNGFGAAESTWATYAYDEVGNQTNQVDALNRKTLFEYDPLGRRTKTTLPGNETELFAYDAGGNLIRQTNFNGLILTNQYDALNRLTNKSSGSYTVAFTHTATGQRATMSDPSGTTSYGYDSRDRLLTNATPQGTLLYAYDLFGNLQSIASTRSGGASITYNYDSLNRLSNVVDAVAGTTTYGFDGVGNLQTVRQPNSVTNTYVYNSLNRLTNLLSKSFAGTVASFAYQLAAAGNRTNLTESINGVNRTNTWAYDALYRLTNETITATGGGTISYRYDPVGNRTNRTSSVTGIATTNATFTTNDLLTSDVYDSNGNTRTNGANTFAYDAENRLTNYNNAAASFVYNGDGIRVRKTVGGTTTFYLVDDRNPTGYAQVMEEATVSGGVTNLAKVYTYGLDLIAQRDVSSGLRTFYGYDGNGHTRYLTTTSATVSDTYAYDAFGTLLTSTGSTANNYLYAGEQYDSTLGLYYLRARYMSTGTGRFWTRDSFAGRNFDPASLHRYTYCGDNPANCVDPSGHEFSISSVYYAVSAQVYLAAVSAGPVATTAKFALASITLAAAINNPAEFVSAVESPSAAASLLAADVAFVAYYGNRTAQFLSGYIATRAEVRPAVEAILGQAVQRIRQIDRNAVVGFRGSVARGYKGPHKNSDPFDPSNFDVDGFVVSDSLAARIPKVNGARFVSRANSSDLAEQQETIDQALRSRFQGLKLEPFTFRVFTTREFLNKAGDSRVLLGE